MECAGMVDVKTYECFPTLIHEIKMDIETYDKINMKCMFNVITLETAV